MVQHPHRNQNYVFNHVGISVPDIEKAAEWYSKHFGFRRINSGATTDREERADDVTFKIYGNKLQKVKVAFLSTGNSVGFELFEFIDPPVKQPDLESWTLEGQYQRGGVFHICFTVPDPDVLCDAVCKDGAAKVGETIQGFDGETGLYFRDPWGNVVELLSCSFEQLLANRW